MLLLISAVHLLRLNGAFAAPVVNSDNYTTYDKVTNTTTLPDEMTNGWVSGPKQRGTWQILYSCLFTLLLCVYTAIHLNVPAKDDTILRVWLRKAKWVLVAVFAPEIVDYAAFRQWYLARKFLKELKEILSSSTDEKVKAYAADGEHSSKFDMKYAYYVLMGGFFAKTDELHNVLKQVTLTPEGVLFLVRRGLICHVDAGEIDDKSKADFFAKSLVCLQVLWIVGQAIERKVANLPITLLEIHTIMHIICALVMYALWFQKPLDVQSPTSVEFGDDIDLLAYILEATRTEQVQTITTLSRYTLGVYGLKPSLDTWAGFRRETGVAENPIPYLVLDRSEENEVSHGLDDASRLYLRSYQNDSFQEFSQYDGSFDVFEYKPASGEIVYTVESGQSFGGAIGFVGYHFSGCLRRFGPCKISLTRKDVRRFELLEKAWRRDILTSTVSEGEEIERNAIENERNDTKGGRNDTEDERVDLAAEGVDIEDERNDTEIVIKDMMDIIIKEPVYWNESILTIGFGQHDYVSHRNAIVDFRISNRSTADKWFLVVALSFTSVVYGCIHLGALSVVFPTEVEKLLWKISCFYMIAFIVGPPCGFVGFMFIVFGFYAIYEFLLTERLEKLEEKLSKRWIIFAEANLELVQSVKNWGMMAFTIPVFCFFILPAVLLYIFSRSYLVIESFISLRRVQATVYELPDLNIMANIPHL